MRPGIELRQDYDAARLRALAKATHDAGQSRRLLALAEIYDGGTRTKAAQVGGVGLQTVRDWVVRFNAHGPEALIDGKAPGNACKLRACHREALLALVESGPIPAVHGVVRWRLKDLVQWLWDEFRIGVSETTLGRELRTLGYRKLSARPRHHAKSDAAVAVFKKSFPRVWRKSRSTRDGKPLKIWFADEARIGQKNKITRRWAKRGTRPSAPRDLRTASTYIFGAICPAEGKAAGLVLPRCTTEAMTLHLAEIAQAVAPGAHAVLLLDQAGWHVSRKLKVPPNITLVPLPAKAPELNPVENIWQFMRENWLSNRIFTSYTDILDHCCAAWTKLTDQPWTIMSVGLREWAHGF
ncbi:IS630 family transposase [Microvirga tunisiensis]|uniref:IS630 family transposase n=1 Tax=Microvirga tunisiensis TaxID=2108360 RepID=UPI003B8474ED